MKKKYYKLEIYIFFQSVYYFLLGKEINETTVGL